MSTVLFISKHLPFKLMLKALQGREVLLRLREMEIKGEEGGGCDFGH